MKHLDNSAHENILSELSDYYDNILSKINNLTVSRIKLLADIDTSLGLHNYYLCRKIVNESNEPMNINLKANVLIITDRLIGAAIGIQYYFQMCTDANVIGIADNISEARTFAERMNIDIIIIAGYLKNKEIYGIIRELRTKENPPIFVFWATISMLIHDLCLEHNINDAFSRVEPMSEFIEFLQSIHKTS